MAPSAEDDRLPTLAAARRARAQQWSRTAWVMALLFATLPVACRLFVGSWGFEEAFEVSILCTVFGAYFHLIGRKQAPSLPDSASLLDRAAQLSFRGDTSSAIQLLTEAIRLNPRLWQAYQYRSEMYLIGPESADAALADISEAIHLAPGEAHLYALRAHIYRLLGDERSAENDEEAGFRCQASEQA